MRTVEEIQTEIDRIKEEMVIEADYCMCGSRVDRHAMGDGHSPVSELDYVLMPLYAELRTAQGCPE